MRLTPRPYQLDALAKVDSRRGEGVSRQLGVAATGLGKTVIFCALAERMGVRTLVLAHRDELIQQAAAEVLNVWPDVPSLGIVKGPDNHVGAHCVIGSVQTLSRANRLDRLCARWDPFVEPDPNWAGVAPFGLVIVDEAHHAAAASYKRILDHLGAGKPGGPFLYGTTATPKRGDGQGLDDVFDEIVFTYDILWGIRAGYLCDIRGKRITVEGLDITKVKTSRGDYQAGDSGRALSEAGAPWAIAQAIVEHARDRLTLAFLPTVATAEETAEACRRLDLRAACVSDATPTDVRRGIIAALKRHDLDVVTNCMVLTEGFNAPRVDCVVVGRFTRGSGLYTQMIGRGSRKHPEKEDCLVLDVVGASNVNSLVTVASLFGLPDRFQDRTHDGTATVAELVAEYEDAEIRAGHLRAEAVELFRRIREEGLSWLNVPRPGDDRPHYTLLVNRDIRLVMRQADPDDDQTWAVQEQHTDPAVGNRTLITGVDLESCQGTAEDYARTVGDRRLLDPTAGWRTKKPTPGQVAAAYQWHLPNVGNYPTRGQLADALDLHIETIRAKKRRRRTTA